MRAKERGCFVWKLLQLLLCQTLIYVVSGQDVCRDPSSDDERAVMLNQPVCYICPRGTSNIEWLFDGAPVSSTDGLTVYSNGSLFIDSVLEKFIGPTFLCRIINTDPRTAFSLSIATISPPTISNTTVNETDNLSIRCRSNANPFPDTQVWLRNGQVVSANSLLEISNIQRAQAGLYTCNTTNTVGSAESTITVTVQYAPSNDLTVTSPVPWMSNTSLMCSFDAVPTPTITWKVNGTEIVSGNDNYIIRTLDTTSFLDIIGTKLDNTGDYMCGATNLLGTSSDQGELIVQVPPDPPSGFSSQDVTTDGFHLRWMTQFDGNSAITSAFVMYKVSGNSDPSTNMTANAVTSHTLSGLMANTRYTVTVFLINDIGASSGGVHEVTTLSLPPLKPMTFTVTVLSSTQLQVDWEPANSNPQRAAITSWELQYQESGSPQVVPVPISSAAARRRTLDNLKKGTSYVVRLRGVNSGGMGEFSDDVTRRTSVDRPSKPLNVTTIELNSMSAKLQWLASEDNGGSPLDEYLIELRNVTGGEVSFRTVGRVDHPTLVYTLTGLVPEIEYNVRISAKNMENNNFSPTTDVLSFTTPKLNYPPNPGVAPGFENLTDTSVTILIPELTGTITHFIVQYRLERVSWNSAQKVEVPATMRSVPISNLAPSSPYQVRFHSVNNIGRSEYSPVLSFMTGPSLEISMIPEDDFIQGAEIVLTCALSGGTSNPGSVTWLKDNQPVNQLNLQNVVVSAHTLTISSATEEHSGVYMCRHTVNNAVVTSEAVIDIQAPSTSAPVGLSLTNIVIIAVSCAAGGGLILLIIVLISIIICYKCRNSSEGNYKISAKGSKNKTNNWIEVSNDNNTGMVYMSSHYPTVRAHDGRTEIEGTPFDYQPPEDQVDHQPFSTFSTMERKHGLRANSTDTHGRTPEPPVIEPPNPMHFMSLERNEVLEDTV